MFVRWKKQLQKKQVEADITKDTIKVLVQNILPVHVGKCAEDHTQIIYFNSNTFISI